MGCVNIGRCDRGLGHMTSGGRGVWLFRLPCPSLLLFPPSFINRERQLPSTIMYAIVPSTRHSSHGLLAVSRSRYRLSIPPRPPGPFRYTTDGIEHLIELAGSRIGMGARDALYRYGIEQDKEYMHGKGEAPGRFEAVSPGPHLRTRIMADPEQVTTVLVVDVRWDPESGDKWEQAAIAIKNSIDTELDRHGLYDTEIGIDMQTIPSRWEKHLGPVGDEDLIQDWPSIRAEIRRLLEQSPSTRQQATAIALFEMRHTYMPQYRPTVYVSMGRECPDVWWAPVEEQIAAFLDNLPHNLTLHMENNEPQPAVFAPGTPVNPYAAPAVRDERLRCPRVGDDISANTHVMRSDGKACNPPIGTLGCYLDIRTKTEPEWTPYALTNYHAIRPCISRYVWTAPQVGAGPRYDLIYGIHVSKTDREGCFYRPPGSRHGGDVCCMTPLEGPSRINRADATHTVYGTPRNTVMNSSWLPTKFNFFDPYLHLFGKPWGASGRMARSAENRRLDWALIQRWGDRQGTNKLPIGGDTAPGILQTPTEGETLDEIARRGGRLFYTVGGVTYSTGHLARIDADVRMPWERNMPMAEEFSFVHEGAPYASGTQEGAKAPESGPVVYNARGAVVGLVSGFIRPAQVESSLCFLVTPIEDVLKHIVEMSKGHVTDIRVAVGGEDGGQTDCEDTDSEDTGSFTPASSFM